MSSYAAATKLTLCTLFWSASFLATKELAADMPAFTVVMMRFVLATVFLFGVMKARGTFDIPKPREIPALTALAFLGLITNSDLQFIAMRTSGVANANWIMAGSPCLSVILSCILLRERLKLSQAAGFAAAMAGVGIVLGLGTEGSVGISSIKVGDLLIMTTALTWALFQITSQKVLRDRSPVFTVAWMFASAAVMQAPLVLLMGDDLSRVLSMSGTQVGAILFLGLICSGLCYMFWYDGLAALPVSRVTVFQYLQPMFGIAVAYVMAGERFTPWLFAGGAMILAGVWAVNRGKAVRS